MLSFWFDESVLWFKTLITKLQMYRKNKTLNLLKYRFIQCTIIRGCHFIFLINFVILLFDVMVRIKNRRTILCCSKFFTRSSLPRKSEQFTCSLESKDSSEAWGEFDRAHNFRQLRTWLEWWDETMTEYNALQWPLLFQCFFWNSRLP